MIKWPLVPFILSLIFGHGMAHVQISTGVAIETLAQGKFLEGSVNVLVDLRLPTGVKEQLYNFSFSLRALRGYLSEPTRWYWKEKVGRELASHAIDNVYSTERTLSEILAFPWVNTASPSRRLKRTAFHNAGRKALERLFGQVIESHLSRIEFRVNLLSTSSLEICHASKNVDVKNNTHLLYLLSDSLKKLQTLLNNFDGDEEQFEVIDLISLRITLVDKYLNELRNIHAKILRTDYLANQNVTLTNIVPLKTLSHLIKLAQAKVQLSPIFELVELNYYKFLKYTWTLHGPLPYTYLLIIPLFNSPTYNVYGFHPFPTPYHNESTTYRVYLPLPSIPQFLFLPQNSKATLATFSFSDISRCKHFDRADFIICPFPHLVRLQKNKNCLSDLVHRHHFPSCIFRKFDSQDPISLQIGPDVFISFSQPTTGTLNCPSNITVADFLLIIHLPPGCSFKTKDFYTVNPSDINFSRSHHFAKEYTPEWLFGALNFTVKPVTILPNLTISLWNQEVSNFAAMHEDHYKSVGILRAVTYSLLLIVGTILLAALLSCLLVYYKRAKASTRGDLKGMSQAYSSTLTYPPIPHELEGTIL